MNNIIAISQPTYLPWCGYFNLILGSDVFVFLDDVQFERRSWQQRNVILLNSKRHYLSVPVLKKGNVDKHILDIEINDVENWREKHLKTLYHAYSKHPFGTELLEVLQEGLMLHGVNSLAEQNIKLITSICKYLNIKKKIIKSSQLSVSGKRSEKLVNICKELKCSNYLSSAGSKDYIEKEDLFNKNNINVIYQDYVCKPYQQFNNEKEFEPYLSVIDMLSNIEVNEALDYLVPGVTDGCLIE